MTGQDRQGSIIQSSGARVQDSKQAQGHVRQRSVIQRRGKGTGWQADSGSVTVVRTGKGQEDEKCTMPTSDVQCYFTVNKLTTDFQHAYREGHSTSTALKIMTDDWLREIYDKNIVGAVLLDFSSAFDIIDHRLLLEKCMCYGFIPRATRILWIKSYLSNRT
jgi:hypothetical protein